MRPSDITDGNTSIRARATMASRCSFNEAVGYYRRKHQHTSKQATPSAPGFNEAVGYYRRKRDCMSVTHRADTGFNEAVGYYRRKRCRRDSFNEAVGYYRRKPDPRASMRPSDITDGNPGIYVPPSFNEAVGYYRLVRVSTVLASMRPSDITDGNPGRSRAAVPQGGGDMLQ